MNAQAQTLLNASEALRNPILSIAATTYALGVGDDQKYLRFTGDGAKTLTLSSAENFAPPQQYHVANRAASGNLTIAPSGVLLNAPKGGTLVLEPGDTVTIKFVGADVADVFGSTAAA